MRISYWRKTIQDPVSAALLIAMSASKLCWTSHALGEDVALLPFSFQASPPTAAALGTRSSACEFWGRADVQPKEARPWRQSGSRCSAFLAPGFGAARVESRAVSHLARLQFLCYGAGLLMCCDSSSRSGLFCASTFTMVCP